MRSNVAGSGSQAAKDLAWRALREIANLARISHAQAIVSTVLIPVHTSLS